MLLIILEKYFLIKQKFPLGEKKIFPAGLCSKERETVANRPTEEMCRTLPGLNVKWEKTLSSREEIKLLR